MGLQDSKCIKKKRATPAVAGSFPCREKWTTVIGKNIIIGFPGHYCNYRRATGEKYHTLRAGGIACSGLKNEQPLLIVLFAASIYG